MNQYGCSNFELKIFVKGVSRSSNNVDCPSVPLNYTVHICTGICKENSGCKTMLLCF